MNFLFKLNRFIFNYARAFGVFDALSDEQFIKMLWKRKYHSSINLENPVTFNEKLQWLKLHDRKKEYTTMVDKCEAKKWIAKRLGSEKFVVKTYGVWDKFEDIDFNVLPNKFVLKTTHDSGGIVVCKNKQELDIKKAKNVINTSLHHSYYKWGREWPYKNVKPRIIAEQYLEEQAHTEIEGLTDYKFYCFNGQPKFLYVAKSNFTNGTKRDLMSVYDLNWKLSPFQRNDHESLPYIPKKPEGFEKMIELSKKLSENIPFLRVDWYEIDGELYVGELTFYPGAGFGEFSPKEYNYEIGNWLDISKVRIEK